MSPRGVRSSAKDMLPANEASNICLSVTAPSSSSSSEVAVSVKMQEEEESIGLVLLLRVMVTGVMNGVMMRSAATQGWKTCHSCKPPCKECFNF